MGIDIHGSNFILYARERGADFSRTATIGRQHMLIGEEALRKNLVEFGYDFAFDMPKRILTESGAFADTFFRALGAETVDSIDASDFEGASVIHDLNEPISEELKSRYSAVIDGGTLEHIFNYPQALKNSMEMVRRGGHFLAITPANNLFGHGFYQFSPELYFSVFTEENGFRLIDVIAFEDWASSSWYRVKEPASVGGRVILINKRPVYLLIAAERINETVPFRIAPQQSDYLADWEGGDRRASANVGIRKERNKILSAILRRMPYGLKRFANRIVTGEDPERLGFNPDCFTEFDPCEGLEKRGKQIAFNG